MITVTPSSIPTLIPSSPQRLLVLAARAAEKAAAEAKIKEDNAARALKREEEKSGKGVQVVFGKEKRAAEEALRADSSFDDGVEADGVSVDVDAKVDATAKVDAKVDGAKVDAKVEGAKVDAVAEVKPVVAKVDGAKTTDAKVESATKPVVTKAATDAKDTKATITPVVAVKGEEGHVVDKSEIDPAVLKFNAIDYMSPWMFTPTYLEVCYASCSAIFLRSPLAQPSRMEIPSPFPPNWHQLVYEWYSSRKRAKTGEVKKDQLVVDGLGVMLKPKFERMVRGDVRKKEMKDMVEQRAARVKEAYVETQKFKAEGNIL